MSEPTLYRINPLAITNQESGHIIALQGNTYLGVLVPVGRCEHGNIDSHPYTTNGEVWAVTIPSENIETCPGAGIGGDEGS